jgi:hypothetical protein
MLARTEIGSHAAATAKALGEAGLQGIKVLAGFATARDGKVREQYAALKGRSIQSKRRRGLSSHPNCRCTFVPAVEDLRGVMPITPDERAHSNCALVNRRDCLYGS